MVPVLTICVVTPLLVILCWKDCRYRLLPNTYTIGMAVLGLIWRFAFGGIPGLVDGLLGGLVCAGFLFIPFLMKGAGGGDLKMMFAAGIFTGFRYCCAEMLFVSIAGLLLGLMMLIAGKVNAARLKHFLRTIFDWRYDRKSGAENLPEKKDEKTRVPFGVAIAIGTVATLLYIYLMERP